MRSVLLSIKPEWCELILEGSKTIELRKSIPKESVPFKCYIYMSKTGSSRNDPRAGKVVAEFICDEIFTYDEIDADGNYYIPRLHLGASRVPVEMYKTYGKGNPIYGWHIACLEIYTNPLPLNKFHSYGMINAKNYSVWDVDPTDYEIHKPPQSYLYVEDKDEVIKYFPEKPKAVSKDNKLIEEYKLLEDPAEQLNYYRNLHYKDPSDSESCIIAWALDKILPELCKLRKEKKHG